MLNNTTGHLENANSLINLEITITKYLHLNQKGQGGSFNHYLDSVKEDT